MRLLGAVVVVMVLSACGAEGNSGAGAPGDSGPLPDGEALGGAGQSLPANPAEPPSIIEMLRRGGRLGTPYRGPTIPGIPRAIGRGAERIAQLQADSIADTAGNGIEDSDPDDAGWDFVLASSATSHTTAASPPNLYGATGIALLEAFAAGVASKRVTAVAIAAAQAMDANPEIDSPPDFVFASVLAFQRGDLEFAGVARDRYEQLRSTRGSATALATFIRDSRHMRNQDGLIAYDLFWLSLSSLVLDSLFLNSGYLEDSLTYAEVARQAALSGMFDIHSASEGFYVMGLAWTMACAQAVGDDELFQATRALLLTEQRDRGAWGTNALRPADDLQSTAHALQALSLTANRQVTDPRRLSERRAVGWLLATQAASGGWPDAAGQELPLVNAEIVAGLSFAQTSGLAALSLPIATPSELAEIAAARAEPLD